MLSRDCTVDVVIPVLNEAHVLARSVETVRQFLAEQATWRWNLVIVDNGSTDGTDVVARALVSRFPEVRFVQLPERGRGRALRHAWMHSDADIMCYTDVDLSTELAALPALVHALRFEGFDVGTGSRLLPSSRAKRSLKREIISRGYNLIVKWVLGTSFSDAQCGFKALTRRVAREIVPQVEDDSWFFDTELLVLAERQRYRIKDLAVAWVEDNDSRVQIFRTAWDDLKGIARLRWMLWRRPHPPPRDTPLPRNATVPPASARTPPPAAAFANTYARPLFITGASGFVGRRVLEALKARGASEVRLLVRDPEQLARTFALPAHWQIVRGALEDPTTWRDALHGVHTVLHLASVTGKARPRAYTRHIVRGTESLLANAQDAGVTRFLYVSSVAAGYADQQHYHYAKAKQLAERSVLAAPLETLIVRPTMVLGQGSQLLDGLRRLATFPVPLLFGSGECLIQPIEVGDLAALLVAALESKVPWKGETLTIGGPERTTLRALLHRIRTGDTSGATRYLHLPINSARSVLHFVEPLLLTVLPFTAGQVAMFANDSVDGAGGALLSTLVAALPAPMHDLEHMLTTDTGHAS